MTHINCLILEDEPIAQEIIEHYIERVPFLHLAAKASNAIEAYEKLKEHSIDLIFCDIQMPQISGLEFLKSLPSRPQIIMTTAFHQHAHEGFELDVTDYLLKPIAFERFLRAIHKAKEKFDAKNMISQQQKEPVSLPEIKVSDETHIFVKEDGKLVKVLFDDIQYVEGMKDYVKIYVTGRFIVTYLTMKKMEENLPPELFVRIHKSYIVSQSKIQSINGNMLMLDTKVQLPIGMQHREQVLNKIGTRLLLR